MPAKTALLRRTLDAFERVAAGVICPPSCAACELPISPAERGFCRDCRGDLPLLWGSPCRRCGEPTVVAQPPIPLPPLPCLRCKETKFRFDEVIAAGVYEGLMSNLAVRAKRLAEEPIAAALGELVADLGGGRLRGLKPDVVTCVPMHWTRRLARQANGPERMAEVIADRIGAPFEPHLLRRIRRTAPQAQLARSQRAKNLRRAFRLGRGFRLNGATVALVDDILTTGATCNAAASVLKRSGAGRVVAVVAARAL